MAKDSVLRSAFRAASRAAALALMLVLLLVRGDVLSPETRLDYALAPLVRGKVYDFLGWEARALWDSAGRGLRACPPVSASEVQAVRRYLQAAAETEAQRKELERLDAGGQGQGRKEERAELAAKLKAAEQEALSLEKRAERVVECLVVEAMAEEGITIGLPFYPQPVFPPVLFEFARPPLALIISPREQIEMKRQIYLNPDMGIPEREALEGKVDSLGVSSLVVGVGGLSTFPSMVVRNAPLSFLVSTVAHEWFHAYFAFRPLGWKYGASRELTTMNETAATIAGDEIGRRILERNFPEELSLEMGEVLPEEGKGGEDLFAWEMRETRLRVDALLAQGQVEEAERYMEEQRRFLEGKGHRLRKLNQAYFAFYGSYATAPEAVDPIGEELKELRRRSNSLKEFVEAASRMSSYQDLKGALGK